MTFYEMESRWWVALVTAMGRIVHPKGCCVTTSLYQIPSFPCVYMEKGVVSCGVPLILDVRVCVMTQYQGDALEDEVAYQVRAALDAPFLLAGMPCAFKVAKEIRRNTDRAVRQCELFYRAWVQEPLELPGSDDHKDDHGGDLFLAPMVMKDL